jgi:hypothetical protein
VPADLPLVSADPRRTNQVLVNLLSNAIKWGRKGTEIQVSAVLKESKVKVMVADRGPGISPQQKSILFKRFAGNQFGDQRRNRADWACMWSRPSLNRKAAGSGWRTSGRSAIFWFTIGQATQLLDEAEPQGDALKALVVDDDRVLADLVSFTLRASVSR